MISRRISMFYRQRLQPRQERPLKPGKSLRASLLPLALVLALACSPAWGAETTNATSDNGTMTLEKITVTANKMEEDIQKVPQSITVIDEFEIEEKGLKTVQDVVDRIPNMLASPYHGTAVSFRGLNQSMFTNNNPVVIYIDGVPTSNRYGFDFSMANVERIEVLRGPQGTLYGKDAMGAVINVVTKDAGSTWRGKINTEYSSWNTLWGLANVSGPLMEDTLSMGINGQYSQTDGWIRNDYPGMNPDVGRKHEHDINGYLLFTPTDRLRVRLSASNGYHKLHRGTELALPGNPKLSDFKRDDLKHQRLDIEDNSKIEINDQSLTASYDFDFLKVESITSHRTQTQRGLFDGFPAATDDPLFDGLTMFDDTDLSLLAEELRFSSPNTEGFRWVGGLYFEKEKTKMGPYGQEFPMFDPETGAYLGPYTQNAESDTDAMTQAVFGQIVFPFAERFELTLGGRYQHIKKEMDLDMYMLPKGQSGPPMFSISPEKSWEAFLPKAALSYALTDNWTAYVSYAQGYMPGGFNNFAMGGSDADNTFEPEQSYNYEAGLKAEYDSWRLAACGFYMDIKDIHVYKSVGAMYLTANAEKAHSQGFELEGTWLPPLDGLEISGALALLEAKYDDYDTGTTNLKGERIDGAPSYSVRLGVDYHHSSGLYGWTEVRQVGDVHYYDGAQQSFVKADPYTLADLKIGYLYEGWDFYGYVKNIFDEEYINGFRSNYMMSVAGFGDPRSFGVGLAYNF
ncbi:MAG: TonB-dependent receptor [Deltaproteobacteria bacterium]|nr:TonB-dependent receptor [Deltaproteobacteria bacterium]